MLATAGAFGRDPEVVWQWYRERRALVRSSQPNAAHAAVVRLASEARDFLLVTQNVDDLHQRAAWQGRRLPADSIVQIHGDLFVTRCVRGDVERRDEPYDEPGVPRCPRCGSLMRPGVVWFDEELDPGRVARVDEYVARGPCDAVVVVGTTAVFDYIVRWVELAAGRTGRIVEINPEATGLSPIAATIIREPAAVALPRLVDALLASGVE